MKNYLIKVIIFFIGALAGFLFCVIVAYTELKQDILVRVSGAMNIIIILLISMIIAYFYYKNKEK